MTAKANYNIHQILISAMFLLGNAVISIPYKPADRNNILSFAVAFMAGIAYFFILKFISVRLFNERLLNKSPYLIGIIYIVTAILIIIFALDCFSDYTDFVTARMLPKTPRLIISVIFAVLIGWCAAQKTDSVLKFTLPAFLITALIVILLFVVAIPRYKPENLALVRYPEVKSVIHQTVKYFSGIYLPLLPLVVYKNTVIKKAKDNKILYGVIIGAVLLLICLLNCLLLFGANVSADMDFPYSDAISTVSVGDLFTRMDVFSYFVFFVSSIIKITVCIDSAVYLLKKTGVKCRKLLPFFLTAIIFLLDTIKF